MGFCCVIFQRWVVNFAGDILIKNGNILVTENHQAIINDVIEVKADVYLYGA